MELPVIQIQVRGDVFQVGGFEPTQWSIYAEVEGPTKARTKVKVHGRVVADVTIHVLHESQLPDEVQEVGAALVWSALRAGWWHKEAKNG